MKTSESAICPVTVKGLFAPPLDAVLFSASFSFSTDSAAFAEFSSSGFAEGASDALALATFIEEQPVLVASNAKVARAKNAILIFFILIPPYFFCKFDAFGVLSREALACMK